MVMPEQALCLEHGGVLGEVLAVHDQVLPVHVDLDVVEPLCPQGVDDVQRHPDVPHQDLHRGLGVLVLEEDRHAAFACVLRRAADPVEKARPALRVGRLERVVVALDPWPDDHAPADLRGEVDRLERQPQRLVAHPVVERAEAAALEERVQVQAARDAVHAVAVERAVHLVELLVRDLLRVVELVVVDEIAEPLDRRTHLLGRRHPGQLGLVAAGIEARSHAAERPDAERCLQGFPSAVVVSAKLTLRGMRFRGQAHHSTAVRRTTSRTRWREARSTHSTAACAPSPAGP